MHAIIARTSPTVDAPDPTSDDWLQPEASPLLARITRRPRLQHQINTTATCTTTTDTGDFFRGDHEPVTAWTARIPLLRGVCHQCPARTACLELALRDREGRGPGPRGDDMVRAGLTTRQLHDLGIAQERDLEEAVARDDEAAARWPRRAHHTGRPSVAAPSPTATATATVPGQPRAGIIDDLEREDDARGLEPHDDDVFHQLVKRLVADGDLRAARAGRAARRTLAQMNASPARPDSIFDDDSAPCLVCDQWHCVCSTARTAPPLPTRPAPHERDGRQPDQDHAGRPHPQHGGSA